MKMIWHQAISKNITIRRNKFSYFFKKVNVVIRLEEDLLLVVSSIINMIKLTFRKLHIALVFPDEGMPYF